MSFELFIARRYLTARRKQAFVSVITLISVLGVMIGVAALVIAIALITGFQEDVQAKILGATSHIMVQDLSNEGLTGYEQVADKVQARPGVVSVTPVVYNEVLITGLAKTKGALLKGLDLARELPGSAWLQKLEAGRIPVRGSGEREGILLGRQLALEIGAQVGDVVDIITPSANLSPMGLLPKRRRFEVTGLFNTGLYEFDATTAVVSLETAQRLFGLEGRVSFLQVKVR
ncbi:MAG TPA: ABC transporter permease, partial [Burkholderiales bacterium]|nr:ABC transporter permease [Burkholderiales bacterium]